MQAVVLFEVMVAALARLLFIIFFLTALPHGAMAAEAEFRFRLNEDPGTLDWGYGEVSPLVVQQLMEGLTLTGKNGEALPAIARSWTPLKAKQPGFQFELNSKARWSDGRRVCAQHFVDAWTRVLSPEFGSPYAHLLFSVRGARAFHAYRASAGPAPKLGFRAEGCGRLVVELEQPISYFPALASHWVLLPVRLDLIEKYGKTWTAPGKLVVTGPYVLAEWKPERHLVLRKNSAYFGEAPAISQLKALIIPSDATALELFLAGDLDWVKDVPYLEKPRLSKTPAYRLFPSYVVYYLGFDVAKVSREERCALAAALDKARIPALLHGGELPAWSIVPPALAPSVARAFPQGFDPGAARAQWAKTAASKAPLTLQYYVKDTHAPLMEWVQQQWKLHLGASIALERKEAKTYWATLHQGPPKIFLSGITAAYAHPYSFLSEFLSQTPANFGRYNSPKYDQAAAAVAAEAKEPTLSRLVGTAEDVLLGQDCAVVPLYFRKTAVLVSDRWKGAFVNPLAQTYFKELALKTQD